MTVGERIKELRTNLGLTQEELAYKIGYKSRATVNKIESGEREITQSMIAKFASALHVTPSVIMGWDDMPTKKEGEIEKIVSEATKREDLKIFFTQVAEMSEEDFEKARKVIEAFVGSPKKNDEEQDITKK